MTERAEFRVVGDVKIHCAGCEQRIDFALRRIGGVSAVQASAKKQKIAVEYDAEKTNRDDVRQQLEVMGYEVEAAN